MPAAILYSRLMSQGRITYKQAWLLVFALFIAIGVFAPLFCADERTWWATLIVRFTLTPTLMLSPSSGADKETWWTILIVGGALAAIALPWFYSNSWPSLLALVPPYPHPHPHPQSQLQPCPHATIWLLLLALVHEGGGTHTDLLRWS